MLQLLFFIFIGILTMFAMEFQINVIAGGRPDHFAMAVALYAALLLGFYFISRMVDSKLSLKYADVTYYLIGGLFGLIAVEWTFMGNYPGSGKGAIQTAMFALWAAVFTVPRLFSIPSNNTLKRARMKALTTILAYSVLSTLVVLIAPSELKLPVQAIIMSAYGLILNFQLVPVLCRHGFSKKLLYSFDSILAICALLNVIFFW